MTEEPLARYGNDWAPWYDRFFDDEDVIPVVDFIVRVARGGAVLELGAGTGRIAIPLALRGLAVTALDSSAAMLDELRDRAAAAGAVVQTIAATYAHFGTDNRFEVIVLAHGGLDLAWPEGEQQASIMNAVRHLAPTGRLLVHGPVHNVDPPPTRVARHDPADGITVLQISTFAATDRLVESYDIIFEAGLMKDILRTRARFSSLSDVDRIVSAAGLRLNERVADWNGAAFGPNARQHVSVYTP